MIKNRRSAFFIVHYSLSIHLTGYSIAMESEPKTRFGCTLPDLRLSLNLLYVGRFLLGMHATHTHHEEGLDLFDEHIETLSDELMATELLHEAAILAGDVLPENTSTPNG